MTDRSVVVRLRGDVSAFIAAMGQAGQTVKGLKDELGKATETEKGRQNLDKVGTAAAGMGAALLAGFGVAAAAAAQFDKQMSEVGAVSGATGKDLAALRDEALQTGKDTAFSATEAAAAEAELAKAGMSVADIMGGGLKGAVSLAAAGQMGLADAATITAQALNMFELKGGAASHVADLLAGAANTSAADMHGLGQGLEQVGLVAHQVGFSLEETTGLLAALADRGLQGSDGATSLKTAIQRLTAPVDQAKTLMESLGISVYDTNGNVKSAADLAGILQKKLGGLSVEERNAAMNTIFGSDAIRAANVLYSLGSEGVQKYTTAVDKSGAAAETARAKTDNLTGDVERLQGSLETLAIESGSGANTGLRALAQGANAAVDAFAALPEPVSTTLTILAGVSGAGLLAAGGLLKARATAAETMQALRDMGPAGTRAADGLGKVGSVAGKAALGLGLLAVMWEGANLISHLTGFEAESRIVTRDVDKMTDAMRQFATTGKAAGELKTTFGANMSGLRGQIDAVGELTAKYKAMQAQASSAAGIILSAGAGGGGSRGASAGYQKQLAQVEENINKADQALGNLVKNGNATAAKAALAQMAEAAGMSTEQLLSHMPQYQAAMDGAQASNSGLARGFGDVSLNAGTMAGSLQDAMRAGQSLKDVFDQLNGGLINSTEAQIHVEDALAGLTESLAKNGQTMDITTAAGRTNQQGLIDVARAARDAAQAKYEETGSLELAKGTYDTYKQKLYETLRQANFTEDAAHALVDQWLKMPPLASTKVEAPGIDATIEKVISLQTHLNGLKDRTITTTVIQNIQTGETRTSTHASQRFERWGGAYEHAQVGLLREAQVYSAVSSGARYAFAEPQTRGEAFIPRAGNHDRAMGILQHAASWYGASVVPDGTATLRRAAGYGTSLAGGGSSGGGGGSSDRLAQAVADLLPELKALARLADRPTVLKVGAREIARANREGERDLGYQR